MSAEEKKKLIVQYDCESDEEEEYPNTSSAICVCVLLYAAHDNLNRFLCCIDTVAIVFLDCMLDIMRNERTGLKQEVHKH